MKNQEKSPFTNLEYIEFTSAEEFKRFRNTPPISKEDIENINWETLSADLVRS